MRCRKAEVELMSITLDEFIESITTSGLMAK